MPKKNLIYLDMDGVIVDFVSALLEAHNRPDLLEKYQAGTFPKEWLFEGELGNDEELWWPVKFAGEAFWETIQPFPWMNKVLGMIEDSGIEWYICTHAQNDPISYSGKMKWIHRHMGYNYNNIIMTKHKHLLANPTTNSLLIDDNTDNCNNFLDCGGKACLFPQPWNANIGKNRITTLRQSLTTVFGKEVLHVTV